MAKPDAGDQPQQSAREALIRSAAKDVCGFFFDFDGVLALIQADPESVYPVEGVIEKLRELSRLVEKIAIVSARPVSFLASRFADVPGLALYGLYGLEVMQDGRTISDPEADKWMPQVRAAIEAARRELPPDLFIEDKRLSVALHYRRCPDRSTYIDSWAHSKAQELGLAVQSGRMTAELKPPVSIDKGTVLLKEIASLDCAWYFGDDISDAKGFAALRSNSERDPSFFGVCVAVANPEVGRKLEDQADLTLESPFAVSAFLSAAVGIFDHAN
jgi:trehalose 6-phosphate phosphatase